MPQAPPSLLRPPASFVASLWFTFLFRKSLALCPCTSSRNLERPTVLLITRLPPAYSCVSPQHQTTLFAGPRCVRCPQHPLPTSRSFRRSLVSPSPVFWATSLRNARPSYRRLTSSFLVLSSCTRRCNSKRALVTLAELPSILSFFTRISTKRLYTSYIPRTASSALVPTSDSWLLCTGL